MLHVSDGMASATAEQKCWALSTLTAHSMDYFQGVVTEFLRADRAVFVNTEYMIQLDEGDAYQKDRHWYCDAIAINHRTSVVSLCEITYSTTLHSLFKRLTLWRNHWPNVVAAIKRDSALRDEWTMRPHIFVPERSKGILAKKLTMLSSSEAIQFIMPRPEVTYLESIVPWKYRSWNGKPYEVSEDV